MRRGKEVTVVVELKARFDEEANINWAEMLESIGAQVVYGVVGLKTHAKMLLVTRREGRRLVRYAHLSTGNYNPGTARLYTDVSYLTADPLLTADIDHVFVHLASQSRLPKLHRLLLAPFQLQRKLLEKIDALAQAALQGKDTRIVVKMNALTDEDLMRALVKAGQCGVKIDLIVRGACMLPAQVPGVTDNIRVRSVIGRFLEHSRVFYFRSGGDEDAVAVERRLDEPQHAAPGRTGLAGDRPGDSPAPHRRMPGRLPARRPRRLGFAARRHAMCWSIRPIRHSAMARRLR